MIPTFDRLERRESTAYVYGPSLSWSIVPDGTQWLGGVSTLVADMNRRRPGWRDEIRRAFSEWSFALGIIFVESPDSGSPIGSDSPTVRIGGNVAADYPRTLAWAYLPGEGRGGDVTFNTHQDYGPGGFDLYSVALHELGHAVAGLADGSSPVMSPSYSGALRGLLAADVDAALESVDVTRSPSAIFSKFGEP